MERKWWHNSVVYQIYPLSFKDTSGNGIGDVNGIIEKLDYLKELGVDVLWLSPIYKTPLDDNGYDISDYYDIDPLFGTLEDAKRMLKEAHDRGIKIIMDLVLNHTSDEHVWFKKALDGDEYYKDFYVWRKGKDGNPPSDVQSIFSGSAWEYVEEMDEYFFHLFSKRQPDLNWENEVVRNELYKMINFWLDLGFDGFRLDVIDLIGKEVDNKIFSNGPKMHDYIQEMYRKCFEGRDVMTVGEMGGANIEMAKLVSDPERKEFSMLFQFEMIALDQVKGKSKWELKELDFDDLKNNIIKWQDGLSEVGWNSNFWNNHDQPRVLSRWGNTDPKYRELSAKVFAGVLHSLRGTPYVYQGEELGMTGYKFNDFSELKDVESLNMIEEFRGYGWSDEKILESIRVKGRDNSRTPMQWNDSNNGGFTNNEPWLLVNPNYKEINAESQVGNDNSVFTFYKKMIELRKKSEISDLLVYGKFENIPTNNKYLFVFQRKLDMQELTVVANFSNEYIKYDNEFISGNIIISNYDEEKITGNEVKPYQITIYLK